MHQHEPPRLTQFFRSYKFYGLHEKNEKTKFKQTNPRQPPGKCISSYLPMRSTGRRHGRELLVHMSRMERVLAAECGETYAEAEP